jgi:uncharacterized protein YkwD
MPVLRCVVLLLLVAFAAACLTPARAQTPASLSGSDFQRDVEKQTFKLINDYRDKEGFAPLKWSEGIAKIARAHSRDMAKGDVDFGHGGFDDRVDQMKALVAGFEGAGENVLYTTELDEVASRAVQMWLHSPHHLRNIRGDYNLSGIGVWQSSSGAIYFTQLFLKVQEPGN